jgi:hypothetical protein
MALDDVPPGDMFWFGTRDPLDAALGGESDDPAVDVLVRDLRAAYLPEGTRPRSEALAAFAGTADGVALGTVGARPDVVPVADRPVSIGRRVVVGAAAFAATITGKVVLGGAVAAATLGGLHATDTIDVPLLPRSPQAQTVPSTVPELPDAHPFNVLVGPPAEAPSRSNDGVPPVDAPAPAGTQAEPSDRSPAAPVDQGITTDDDRTDPGAPATTAPPIADGPADPPVPTTAGPSEQPPATEAPKRAPGAAPEPDAGADRPAAGEQAPAPAAEQETPARP